MHSDFKEKNKENITLKIIQLNKKVENQNNSFVTTFISLDFRICHRLIHYSQIFDDLMSFKEKNAW